MTWMILRNLKILTPQELNDICCRIQRIRGFTMNKISSRGRAMSLLLLLKMILMLLLVVFVTIFGLCFVLFHDQRMLIPLSLSLFSNESNASLNNRRDRSDRSDPKVGTKSVSSIVKTKANDWIGCVDPVCIDSLARQLARPYPDRSDRSSWCRKKESIASNPKRSRDNNKIPLEGIVLIKVPKSASSTSAGVAIRIGRKYDCDMIRWDHRMAHEYDFQSTDSVGSTFNASVPSRSSSFVFTTVRNPGTRAVSTIFFHIVSRLIHGNVTGAHLSRTLQRDRIHHNVDEVANVRNAVTSDKFIIRHLRHFTHAHQGAISEGQGGFTIRYIHPTAIPPHSVWTPTERTVIQSSESTQISFRGRMIHPEATVEHVRRIIQDAFDFILIPERMDESLVAMALTMSIDIGDVLVTSSKVSTTRHVNKSHDQMASASSSSFEYHLSHGPKNVFSCIPIEPSFVSPVVQEYLESKEWYTMNYGDYLLHAAAHYSLNLTIDRLGHEQFQAALTKFRQLKQLEQQQCAPKVQFPCAVDGTPQLAIASNQCYLRFYDFGCGYKCIDTMIEKYHEAK